MVSLQIGIPKEQYKIDNPGKLATQGTQYEDKKQHNMCWTPLCANKHNTNNVNKTCALLQTTGDKDEPIIVFMQKS
jgi:hypothetical protein